MWRAFENMIIWWGWLLLYGITKIRSWLLPITHSVTVQWDTILKWPMHLNMYFVYILFYIIILLCKPKLFSFPSCNLHIRLKYGVIAYTNLPCGFARPGLFKRCIIPNICILISSVTLTRTPVNKAINQTGAGRVEGISEGARGGCLIRANLLPRDTPECTPDGSMI